MESKELISSTQTIINENDYMDIVNELVGLDSGWVNQWAYEDCYNKLIQLKPKALRYKKQIRSWGYDIDDVYKQLEEFEYCVSSIKTITNTRDEAIILSAVQYAKSGKTIIFNRWETEQKRVEKFFMTDINLFLDTQLFETQKSLFFFYIMNKENPLCLEYLDIEFIPFLDKCEGFLRIHPKEQSNFYFVPLVISYCKILLKQKRFNDIKNLIENYTLIPIRKTDTTNLEKIKEKIYRRI